MVEKQPPEGFPSVIPSLRSLPRAHRIYSGYPYPLGAHLHDDGALFAIFSRHATMVTLLLFERPEDPSPYQSIELDSPYHRTGDIWHVWVEGIRAGQAYAYRVEGPYDPEKGHRFNKYKLVIDPYATAVSRQPHWDFFKAKGYDPHAAGKDLSLSIDDNEQYTPRCIVSENRFEWEDDCHPRISWSDTVIYETHVRGLTIHPSSMVGQPGTFRGVVEKIPYFKELGITALEFLPIQEFNEHETPNINPTTGTPLVNYWGYSTIAFFAPKATYGGHARDGVHIREFKRMVKELHKAGIEVILDIVFNHTAEGNELGPTLSFRGLDNAIYYLLDKDRRRYRNFSGCGNTLNCNHPVVRQFIIDCLIYWVVKMHVDGFRFDLASIMGRDENGEILMNPPLLEEIAENPILQNTKLIAEAWDAAGAYQVGSFPGHRWSEWNGRFRDDVRLFWRGDPGMTPIFASRISGSADIYQRSGKEPLNSINFITCHDGFTLNDLVSYNRKHNETNGESNRDGTVENYSSNYGVEGDSDDPYLERVRIRQIKNFIATLFVSRGVPLFLGGDEFRRTQGGNNNAFCQDNDISWYNWGLLQRHGTVHRFTREMIAFRKRNTALREVKFYTGDDIDWYGCEGNTPNWNDGSPSLACAVHGPPTLFMMFHAGLEERSFVLPPAPSGFRWYGVVDTALDNPDDIRPEGDERWIEDQHAYTAACRSLVILVAKGVEGRE